MRVARAIVTGFLFSASLVLYASAKSDESPATPRVSRTQAANLLETLKDPEKRARFTSLLEAYVNTLPAEGSVAVAGPNDSTHRVATSAKTSRASIADMLARVFDQIQHASAHFAHDFQSITDFAAISIWLGEELDDATERKAFLFAIARIASIVLVTVGVEWFIRRFIQRHARKPEQASHGASNVANLRDTFVHLWVTFGAILGAAVVGNAAILLVADLPVARTVAFGVVNTYLALRFLLALLDAFIISETISVDGTGPRLASWLRALWILFFSAVATQILVADIAAGLGASEAIQDALEKCIAFIAHGLAIAIVIITRRTVSDWIKRRSRLGSYWGLVTEAAAAIWPYVAVAIIAGSWLLWALDVPDAYHRVIRLILSTLFVLLIGRFFSNFCLDALDRRMVLYAKAPTRTFGSRMTHYRRSARLTLQTLLIVATLLALTEAWGMGSLEWFSDGHPAHRFAAFAIQLLVLATIGVACWEAADLAVERRVSVLMDSASLSRATRLRTLQPIIRVALLILIALLVIMTALNAIGVNVGPLLAGASIIGVALGFGSQKLVQDFITGIFLLVEDAVDVGDWVTVGGLSGSVEHLSIRVIRLRAGDGSLHLIPFSSVTSVTNTNRGIGNAAVSVNVDPSEDTDRVSAMLLDIAQQMRQEPEYAVSMQSDLQLWGVDKVDGTMVTIAGQIVCTDSGRWPVQREFNRRMKKRFERDGVVLSVPQQSLRIASQPQQVVLAREENRQST